MAAGHRAAAHSVLDDGEHNATLDRSGIEGLPGSVLMETDMRSYYDVLAWCGEQTALGFAPCARQVASHEAEQFRRLRSGRTPMKSFILAAIAALSLTAAVAPVANAATFHNQTTTHQGPYDNTGHGPQETGMEGGGG